MIKFTIEDIVTPFATIGTDDVWDVIKTCDQPTLRHRLQYMKYSQFLRTPYWRVVASKVKHAAGGRCQMCNSDHKIEVHHRTYDFRGQDHLHLKELTCLCRKCHGGYHNRTEKSHEEPVRCCEPVAPRGPAGLTIAAIARHKHEYPTFKDTRLADWLTRTNQWQAFNTVADANRAMCHFRGAA
jgi:predicted deacetylase